MMLRIIGGVMTPPYDYMYYRKNNAQPGNRLGVTYLILSQ